MVIQYCKVAGGNFGDDLNLWIWPTLFPDLPALEGRALFYGTGTLLGGRHDSSITKLVLGAGIGEAGVAVPGKHWDFRWVRGPCTAREFGLPRALGLGDSALLLPGLGGGPDARGPVGLIPHHKTWESYDWDAVAARAGMRGINPKQSPLDVLRQMRGCSRIVSESLHGAIFADAIGIPWAACVLAHRFNEFKWRDWLATIDRAFAPFVIERGLVRGIGLGKSLANHMARLLRYQRHTRRPGLRPVAAASRGDADRVAEALFDFSRQDANFACSHPAHVGRQKQQMLDRCEDFARDYHLAMATPQEAAICSPGA